MMKTRSSAEMFDLILAFAMGDERIRVLLLNGSRANPDVPSDPFQDYDLAAFVTDIQPFRCADDVVPSFGKAMVVEQPLIGPWPPDDAGCEYHNYNIQLIDGNRVDLSFYSADSVEEHLNDSLTVVLLDKDGRVPLLGPPDERSYSIARPTKALYRGCCTGFFFALGSHIPKTLWRRRLPLLKAYIEGPLRRALLMMLSWEIGIRLGWETNLGPKGKGLEQSLPPDAWEAFEATYVASDVDRLWDSLFVFHRLFAGSARFVAEQCGFSFPDETSEHVLRFLRHVRTLPRDAARIY